MGLRFPVLAVVSLLTACGGGGGSDPPPPNRAPVAVATISVDSAHSGDVVTLSATGSSDSDGQITTYAWSQNQGSTVTLSSTSASSTQFTAPALASDSTLSFTLRITDDDGATASDSVSTVVQQATFAVSGTISAADGTAVDGDVNDPAAPLTPNNVASEAQSIPNPVTVVGYLNVPGAGEDGPLQQSGDASDFYRVQLVKGQHISLAVADTDVGDPDLYLWDETGTTIVDYSIDVDESEDIDVADDGVYLIEAEAYSGFTNYTLVVGQPSGATALSLLASHGDFVPGELILQRRPASASAVRAASDHLTGLGIRPASDAVDRPVRATVQLAAASVGLGKVVGASTGGVDHLAAMPDDLTRQKYQTLLAVKSLQKDTAIEYAQPNFRMYPQAVPDDPHYPLQWHYPMIHLPAAWDLTMGDPGVRVAVIDTGILLHHPDMIGQVDAGFDFVSSTASSNDGDGIDADADDPGDSDGTRPSSFHGTHVAGTIAAATNNGYGVAGIAPNVRLLPVRVLGVSGDGQDVVEGIRFAAGLTNASGTQIPPVDVMNLSLGTTQPTPCPPSYQAAFDAARDAGTIVVVAAGNSAQDASLYAPANCRDVITVGAVDMNGDQASYSNFGTTVDVLAPGGDTEVDLNGDGYPDGVLSAGADDESGAISYGSNFKQGTSMATPHVAGVMALMRSVDASLTPSLVDQFLAEGDLTDSRGIIDAYASVSTALDSAGTPPTNDPTLTANPSSLNFGSRFNHADLVLRVSGGGTLSVDPPTTVSDTVTVSAVSVDANGLGTYGVDVDRTGLPDGIYTDTITFTSSGNTVQVPVIIQVTSAEIEPNVGHLYVLLLNAQTNETVEEFDLDADRGLYSYTIAGLDPGSYVVVAGTDSDNDGFICDAGESCGVFPTLDSAQTIDLTEDDVGDVDFSVGPLVALPNAAGAAASVPSRALPRKPLKVARGKRRF